MDEVEGQREQVSGLSESMARYIDGDARAFVVLHDALAFRLRGYLYALVRSEAACDDLLQRTYLKAHVARRRFRPMNDDPDGAVLAWYFAIARNVAMDFLRHRSRRRDAVSPEPTPVGQDVPDARPNAEQAYEAHQAQQRLIGVVRAAVERLPDTQREVVELHKLRGLPMADVARRVDAREGTVRVRAHRAYRGLATLLRPRVRPLLGYAPRAH